MTVLMIGKISDIKCYYKKINDRHLVAVVSYSFSIELLMNLNACIPSLQSSSLVFSSFSGLCKDKAL